MSLLKYIRLLFAVWRDERGWSTEMEVTGVTEIDETIPEFCKPRLLTQ